MKKKIAAGVLSIAILVAGASAAFAATDSSKLGEIKSLYQQMFTIQKQIVDKEVEAGVITPDQATSMKNVIDQKAQLHEQAIDNGQVFGPGAGMGFGKGFGQRGAGSGICNFQAQAPATSQETAN